VGKNHNIKKMNEIEIIEKTKEFIKNRFLSEPSGHDWFHILRVYQLADYIGSKEPCNLFEVHLTALFHDVADWKFSDNSETETANIVTEILSNFNLNKSIINQIISNIKDISFKGAKVLDNPKNIETQIVQDADRLDAIGAIGVARAFAYGGFKHREMYNTDIEPVIHNTFEEYKKNNGTTINHFYEKLLLLKDRMNTRTAKEIATKRHQFMELFLNEFIEEWNCKL